MSGETLAEAKRRDLRERRRAISLALRLAGPSYGVFHVAGRIVSILPPKP